MHSIDHGSTPCGSTKIFMKCKKCNNNEFRSFYDSSKKYFICVNCLTEYESILEIIELSDIPKLKGKTKEEFEKSYKHTSKKISYKELAFIFHPDISKDSNAIEKMQLINANKNNEDVLQYLAQKWGVI